MGCKSESETACLDHRDCFGDERCVRGSCAVEVAIIPDAGGSTDVGDVGHDDIIE